MYLRNTTFIQHNLNSIDIVSKVCTQVSRWEAIPIPTTRIYPEFLIDFSVEDYLGGPGVLRDQHTHGLQQRMVDIM